jgi:hypothetical protein
MTKVIVVFVTQFRSIVRGWLLKRTTGCFLNDETSRQHGHSFTVDELNFNSSQGHMSVPHVHKIDD